VTIIKINTAIKHPVIIAICSSSVSVSVFEVEMVVNVRVELSFDRSSVVVADEASVVVLRVFVIGVSEALLIVEGINVVVIGDSVIDVASFIVMLGSVVVAGNSVVVAWLLLCVVRGSMVVVTSLIIVVLGSVDIVEASTNVVGFVVAVLVSSDVVVVSLEDFEDVSESDTGESVLNAVVINGVIAMELSVSAMSTFVAVVGVFSVVN